MRARLGTHPAYEILTRVFARGVQDLIAWTDYEPATILACVPDLGKLWQARLAAQSLLTWPIEGADSLLHKLYLVNRLSRAYAIHSALLLGNVDHVDWAETELADDEKRHDLQVLRAALELR